MRPAGRCPRRRAHRLSAQLSPLSCRPPTPAHRARQSVGTHQKTLYPPSSVSTEPVMKLDASLARNTIAGPSSSGSPALLWRVLYPVSVELRLVDGRHVRVHVPKPPAR